MNTMINVPSGLLYTLEKKIFKLDYENFSNSEMKFRSSKLEFRNQTTSLSQMSNNGVLSLSMDHCLRYVHLEKEISLKKTQVLDFLCPYCLSIFSSSIALVQNHFDVHLGPISCHKCNLWHIFLYSKIFTQSNIFL